MEPRAKANDVHRRAEAKRPPAVVPHYEWTAKRQALLKKEKDLTRHLDEVVKARRALPMEKVDKDYVFGGFDGPISLSALFGDKNTLVIQHMMFEAEAARPCPSCSQWADGFNGILPHIQVNTAFAVVGKAPVATLKEFGGKRGWKFAFVSSLDNSFNADYCVENTPERNAAKQGPPIYNYSAATTYFPGTQYPGVSVFMKTPEGIFHTYSLYARGLEQVNNMYPLLDLLPFGRDGFHPSHPEDYCKK